MMGEILYCIPIQYLYVRVIRLDGLFIYEFPTTDMYRSKKYFDEWCERNFFNIEKIEERKIENYKALIYFVS